MLLWLAELSPTYTKTSLFMIEELLIKYPIYVQASTWQTSCRNQEEVRLILFEDVRAGHPNSWSHCLIHSQKFKSITLNTNWDETLILSMVWYVFSLSKLLLSFPCCFLEVQYFSMYIWHWTTALYFYIITPQIRLWLDTIPNGNLLCKPQCTSTWLLGIPS